MPNQTPLRLTLAFALHLIFYMLFPVLAKTQTIIEFKNDTKRDIFVAYAYYEEEEKAWYSLGWYKVEKHNTMSWEMGTYENFLYVRAFSNGFMVHKEWGSGFTFCCNPIDQFEYKHADIARCRNKAQFSEWQITSGKTNTYTFY